MKPKIAIVNSSSFGKIFPEYLKKLKGIGRVIRINVPVNISEENLIKKLKGINGIIASVTPKYTRKVLENLKELILISRHGIGTDNIDIEAAVEMGIVVCKVPGEVEREAMAEHTIALMLAVCRKLVNAYSSVCAGDWKKRAEFVGIEIKNKKIGIIGIGNIGKRVVEILKKGFNSEVFAYDSLLDEEEIKKRGATPVKFNKLLKSSDVISLHSSLNPSSYHMLGEKEFSMMKEGVILINTARGELVEEKALINALKSGKVKGYGADVSEGEPIGKNYALLKFKNVLIVPHIGAYTYECLEKMDRVMVESMEKLFLKKRIPETIANPEVIRKGIKKWG